MDILALIPARGGSKSIPRKNIRIVGGKPLIAHTIERALDSQLITRVVVSTDDEEIAVVSREYGAETPFLRPAEYAQDQSQDIEVFDHALRWFLKNENYVPDVVVHLSPPMPLRRVQTIDRAVQCFIDDPSADSLRSVNLSEFTPFKMWLVGAEGYMEPVTSIDGVEEPYNMPRQKLPLVYWQNGYIYITRPRVVLEQGSMTGQKILPFVVEEPCVELDYEDSIEKVEELLANWSEDMPVSKSMEDRHPS